MRCLNCQVSAVGLFTIRKAMIFLLGREADTNKHGGGFRKPPPDNFGFKKTPNSYTYFSIHASPSTLSCGIVFFERLLRLFSVKICDLTHSRKFIVNDLSEK
jgi:hypothetical protein